MSWLSDLAPSLVGAVGGILGQKNANSANAAMARENRNWQEYSLIQRINEKLMTFEPLV